MAGSVEHQRVSAARDLRWVIAKKKLALANTTISVKQSLSLIYLPRI